MERILEEQEREANRRLQKTTEIICIKEKITRGSVPQGKKDKLFYRLWVLMGKPGNSFIEWFTNPQTLAQA